MLNSLRDFTKSHISPFFISSGYISKFIRNIKKFFLRIFKNSLFSIHFKKIKNNFTVDQLTEYFIIYFAVFRFVLILFLFIMFYLISFKFILIPNSFNIVFISTYLFALMLDYTMRMGYWGDKNKKLYLSLANQSFLNLYIIFFIANFLVITILGYTGNYITIIQSLFIYFNINPFYIPVQLPNLNMFYIDGPKGSPSNNLTVTPNVSNNINNATININGPEFRASITKDSLNTVAAVGSSAAGITAGMRVANMIQGPPAAKVGGGLATMAVVQGTTAIIKKVLDSSSSGDGSKKNFFNPLPDSTVSTNTFNDYPLNLIPELNTIISAMIVFLLIIFNTFIVTKLSSTNYERHLPNNKIGNFLKFIISRYIKIWIKTSNFLIIYCYIMLFISTIVLKFTLTLVLNQPIS